MQLLIKFARTFSIKIKKLIQSSHTPLTTDNSITDKIMFTTNATEKVRNFLSANPIHAQVLFCLFLTKTLQRAPTICLMDRSFEIRTLKKWKGILPASVLAGSFSRAFNYKMAGGWRLAVSCGVPVIPTVCPVGDWVFCFLVRIR